MIDFVKLPQSTTIECNLSDLPTTLGVPLKIHRLDQEDVFICMVSKYHSLGDLFVEFQVITASRVARIVGKMYKNVVIQGDITIALPNVSMFLKDFVGLNDETSSKYTFLKVLGRYHSIKFQFYNEELLLKFTSMLWRVVDEIQSKHRHDY